MKYILMALLTVSLSTSAQQRSILKAFPDVLKLGYHVDHEEKIETNVFSDLGAWHAYTLPDSPADYGAFIGPMVMDLKGRWLANSMSKLHVRLDNKTIDLSGAKAEIRYYPGRLEQIFLLEELKVLQQLIFVNNRTAMIRTSITNLSSKNKTVQLEWSGGVLNKESKLSRTGHTILVNIDKHHHFQVLFPNQSTFSFSLTGQNYRARLPAFVLASRQTRSAVHQEYYNLEGPAVALKFDPIDFNTELKANSRRWSAYLNDYFNTSGLRPEDTSARRLAVKCIVTLITNWRSKAKDLLHDGVFPSLNYQGFYGFWSWDSWKQAVGLSYFSPKLAQSNILSMFDYQDAHGMVADCVYTDKRENNWRDTKPPLAAWAVWALHERSADLNFLKTIYPKLVLYHQWWYKNRDHDQNGLCEYGATDGTRIAAAWESGMDNAVRFDQAKLFKNNISAWSLNQESVDLNAYLYAEKEFLAKIAAAIGLHQEATKWRTELQALQAQIDSRFYNNDRRFYYDRLMDGQWITAEGPEGWIPLWAGLSNPQQAESVLKMLQLKTKFNTYVPLPTLAADHPQFNPTKGYWRGPVWLDQVYFGLNGLHRYGYHQEANSFFKQLLRNADGMMGQGPVYENYHPNSGKGLNAMNFSWSAAHLLMMLKENRL
jgi:putative isomerase